MVQNLRTGFVYVLLPAVVGVMCFAAKTNIPTGYSQAIEGYGIQTGGGVPEREGIAGDFNLPQDTSPRFDVSEIKIIGNKTLPTERLIASVPSTYKVRLRVDGKIASEEVYDFRAVKEIFAQPGTRRSVSQHTIQGLTQYILDVYQKAGYVGIYVYVPTLAVQGRPSVPGGLLELRVIEGFVEDVNIRHFDFDKNEKEKGWLSNEVVRDWSPVEQGKMIKKKPLDEFVRLLNYNPDRYVAAVVKKGTEPNALQVSYDLYENNPWHWYLQVDNAGRDKRQWNPRFGLVNTNLTGRDDRFAALWQSSLDSKFDDNWTTYGSYEVPVLSPRLRIGVFAGYSEFDLTDDTAAGIPVDFRGNGWFVGSNARYNVAQFDDWMFDALMSYSHEVSKVVPDTGIGSDYALDLLGFGTELHRRSERTETSLSFNRIETIGGSDKAAIQTARAGATNDFALYIVQAYHKQYIDFDRIHEVKGLLRSIDATDRVAPAKMTAFGGLYTVRGYAEDELIADEGLLFSGQYRYDLTRAGIVADRKAGLEVDEKAMAKKLWPPNVSLVGFTDYAHAEIEDPAAGEDADDDLWSIGAGTLLEAGRSFSAGIYYGLAVTDGPETPAGSGRWHFNFILRW